MLHLETGGRGLLLHFSGVTPAAQALHVDNPEGPVRAGLDAALIASFPSYPYKVPAAPDVESGQADGYSCQPSRWAPLKSDVHTLGNGRICSGLLQAGTQLHHAEPVKGSANS